MSPPRRPSSFSLFSTRREDFSHTPCYCEENVLHMCQRISSNSSSSDVLDRCSVVFVSNARRAVPLWRQRAAAASGGEQQQQQQGNGKVEKDIFLVIIIFVACFTHSKTFRSAGGKNLHHLVHLLRERPTRAWCCGTTTSSWWRKAKEGKDPLSSTWTRRSRSRAASLSTPPWPSGERRGWRRNTTDTSGWCGLGSSSGGSRRTGVDLKKNNWLCRKQNTCTCVFTPEPL